MKTIDDEQGIVVEYGDAQKNPCNSALFQGKITDYDNTQTLLNKKLSEAGDLNNKEKAIFRSHVKKIPKVNHKS